jgi:uncharacterized protein (DUF1800 family)
MKRFASSVAVAALLTAAVAILAHAAGRFEQKLTGDRQILHVLNRLTYGPRPADIEQIRRTGVEKWIDQQLHPERIPENPVLDTRVKPLETVQLANWEIAEKYPVARPAPVMRPPSVGAMQSLAPQQRQRLLSGSIEERMSILSSLNPDVRKMVLTAIPPQVLQGLPQELRDESASLRQAEQEELQKANRRLRPPLNELLTRDQIQIARSGAPEEKLALIDSFEGDKREQIIRTLGLQPFMDVPQLRREAMRITQPQQLVNTELIENKLFRSVYSNRQLEEVLVDFWMNHFNVYNAKGPERMLLTGYERDAIRPHVLGHFKDLLMATARHPAMLFYLDNWQSQVPRDDQGFGFQGGGRRPGLNENYGRELLELHTLGVDGGYTQDDVIAVARAFTGWTIYDQAKYAEFQFNPAMHDRKEKVVLGHTLPAGQAEQDGLDVIEILAHHPSTAKFISKKLAQRFVADDPPQSLVNRMAATFTSTDGDLRAVLQTMFASTEFLSEGAWQAKVKSPLEVVVSAVRAMNADVSDTFALAQRIAELGQPLYGKLEPTGYPNTGEVWTNTAGVLGRINFATALSGSQIPGVTTDLARFETKDARAIARDLLGVAPSPATLTAIEKGLEGNESTPSLLTTLVLSSPDFQRR